MLQLSTIPTQNLEKDKLNLTLRSKLVLSSGRLMLLSKATGLERGPHQEIDMKGCHLGA